MKHPNTRRQSGAALLLAMLTVALVATLASAALWQQWRAREIETAERQRLQASWILTGALDWSRLILREDARANQNSGSADHLGEPWATPLEEARLSSFLAADKANTDQDLMPAFLSGEIIDQQSVLNFLDLVTVEGEGAAAKAVVSASELASFTALFAMLNLPQSELTRAVEALRLTTQQGLTEPEPSATPLTPARFGQLVWLGLSPATIKALQAHVGVLPERTALNLNTASAQALSASLPGLDLAQAQQVVQQRATQPYVSLAAAAARIPGQTPERLGNEVFDVRSRYFEVRVRLRLDDTVIEERSLVVRNGLAVTVVWRERAPAQ